jgi:hypothetical protein
LVLICIAFMARDGEHFFMVFFVCLFVCFGHLNFFLWKNTVQFWSLTLGVSPYTQRQFLDLSSLTSCAFKYISLHLFPCLLIGLDFHFLEDRFFLPLIPILLPNTELKVNIKW